MKVHLAILFLYASVAIVSAETVVMKNGDRITGAVVSSDGKEMTFKTEYAGEIKIQWASIQELTSDKKLYVVTPEKKTVAGAVTTQNSRLEVSTAQEGTVVVPLGDVKALRSEAAEQKYEKSLHPGLLQGWEGGLNFGFALARGNSETRNVNLAFTAARQTLHDKLSLYANSLYSTNDKAGAVPATTANTILGGLRYDRNLTSRIFGYGSADFQFDELQDLDLRSIFGGGLGLHVIKSDRTTLDLLGGGNYTREQFGTGLTRNLAGLTIGDEFMHKIGAGTVVNQHFYFYPDLSNTGDYRFALDVGTVTKLNKWLGWQNSFNDRYLSAPLAGNKKNDVIFTTGLNVSFTH
jgi:putative salt-induced outer membrane protein YdiY